MKFNSLDTFVTLGLTIWLCSCLALNSSCKEPSPVTAVDFRVVGYLPDYRMSELSADMTDDLTDLILFSGTPTATGEIDLSRLANVPWERILQLKKQQRFRLMMCLGGWERSIGFTAMSADSMARQRFVRECIDLCLAKRLDGIDIDWEHPKDEKEQNNYATLLREMALGFKPIGLSLSVTMASWQTVPKLGLNAVDSVQIMAYDHPGEHATFDLAKRDVEQVAKQGVAQDKIVLGMPFYGRHVDGSGKVKTYREIVTEYPSSKYPSRKGNEVDGYFFNSAALIGQKTRFALEQGLAGVMIWEIGQDSQGEDSLLKTIRETVSRRSTSTK
jgi:chitinase